MLPSFPAKLFRMISKLMSTKHNLAMKFIAKDSLHSYDGCNFIASNSYSLQYVQTELTAKMDTKYIDTFGGFMSTEMVVKGEFYPF